MLPFSVCVPPTASPLLRPNPSACALSGWLSIRKPVQLLPAAPAPLFSSRNEKSSFVPCATDVDAGVMLATCRSARGGAVTVKVHDRTLLVSSLSATRLFQ